VDVSDSISYLAMANQAPYGFT